MKLTQVEPDYGSGFVVRPLSLTPEELGDLAVTVAVPETRTPVMAWVKYPAVARHVRGLAVAWTSRAVYVEWEDRGTHRAWLWASAVERITAGQAADQAGQQEGAAVAQAGSGTQAGTQAGTKASAPSRSAPAMGAMSTTSSSSAITALSTEPLVRLVNAELALIGTEFVLAMSKPAGPFSSVVFGTIEGHHVRLHFHTEPATDMCSVLLVRTGLMAHPGLDGSTTADTAGELPELPEQSIARTFDKAIEGYPWAAAVEAVAGQDVGLWSRSSGAGVSSCPRARTGLAGASIGSSDGHSRRVLSRSHASDGPWLGPGVGGRVAKPRGRLGSWGSGRTSRCPPGGRACARQSGCVPGSQRLE